MLLITSDLRLMPTVCQNVRKILLEPSSRKDFHALAGPRSAS